MTTAAVRHRETRVAMRGTDADLLKFTIHAAMLRDTGSVSASRNGSARVWCNTMDAVAALQALVDAYGYTAELRSRLDTQYRGMTVKFIVRPE
jgi:hypothetical protein